MADQYTAGQLLVPIKPDARGAATKVRKEFETMQSPTVRVDADIRELQKKLASENAKLDQLNARKVDPKVDLDIADANAKAAQLRAKLGELQSKTTSPKVDADIMAAQAKLDRVESNLRRLNSAKADPQVDLDIANAEAKLAGMRAKMDQLRAQRVRIQADADTATATGKLSGLANHMARLNGQTARVKVDADTGGASSQLGIVRAQGLQLNGLTPTVRVNANVTTAIAGLFAVNAAAAALGGGAAAVGSLVAVVAALGPAAAIAGGALGAAALAFGGVGDALTALSSQQETAGADAQASAQAQAQAAAQVQTAQQGLADASQGASRARSDAARNVQRAEQQAAQGIAQAQEQVGSAQRSLASATSDAGKARRDAARNVSRAEQEAAEGIQQAQEQLANAQRALASAARDASKARREAAASVAEAEQSAARSIQSAREQAARAIAAAEQAAASAHDRLRSATSELAREQGNLTRAWEDGRRSLQDLQDQVDSNKLDSRQAKLDLSDARKELAEARKSGDGSRIARAQLGVDRQLETIDQLAKQTRRLSTDNARAQREGVAGTDSYIDALERVRAAQEQVSDASQASGQADLELQRARSDGARTVAQAEMDGAAAVAKARAAGAEQIAAADERVADARRTAASAERGVEKARVDGAARVAEAQRQGAEQAAAADARVADARRQLAEAQRGVDQARIAGAEQVADAQREGARSIEEADKAVLNAQRALTAAMLATGNEGSSAADKVAQAFANLSPAAAAFARYLWSLKPALDQLRATAAQGLFPPLMAGLQTLMTRFSTINVVVGQFASAMGQALGYILARLADPVWMNFFTTLGNAAGPIMNQLARVFMHVAESVAGLLLALLPFTPAALNVVSLVGDMLTAWTPFIAFLVGVGIPVANEMIATLVRWGQAASAYIRTPEGAATLNAFFAAIGDLVQNFADKLVILWPLIESLVVTLFKLVDAAGPVLNVILELVVNALTPLVDLIGWLAPVLGPLLAAFVTWRIVAFAAAFAQGAWNAALIIGRGVMIAWALLTGTMTVAQLGLNAAMLANPIGLVIVAIAALVAGVIYAYTHFEWFRNIVDGAWRGIVAAAQWAWTTILQPIYSAMVAWITGTLVPAVLYLWHNVFVPAWNGIVAVVSWAWVNIIQPYFQALGWYLSNILGPALLFLWQSVFVPAFQAIGAVVSWAWVNVIQPAFAALGFYFSNILGPALLWLWQSVFVPAFTAIAAVITWAWVNVIQPYWSALVLAAQTIGNIMVWLWQSVIVPAWTAIGNAIMWAWVNIIQPIWNALSLAARVIAAVIMTVVLVAFQVAWAAISTVISIAWNTIILPVWNSLVAFVQTILAPAIMWFWNAIIVPAWNGIGLAISFVWNTIILPIWNALVAFVRTIIAPAIMFLWQGIIVPAWNGIGAAISFVWNAIILPIWNALVGFVRGVIVPTMMWLWNTIIVPVWNGIGAAIRLVWQTIILPVWNALIGFIRATIVPVMQWLYGSIIKPVWDRIGAAIRVVWDRVIRPAFDAINAGLGWLARGFQTAVDQIGRIWDGLRSALATPVNFVIERVWNGGIVPAWNKVAQLVGLGPIQPLAPIRFAEGGLHNGREDHRAQITRPGGPTRVWSEPETGGEAYIPMHERKRSSAMPVLGEVADRFGLGLVPQGDLRYYADGGMVWPKLAAAAKADTGARVSSSYRPGDNGYHGKGKAVDLVGNLGSINRTIAEKYPQSTQLIYTPGINLLNGRRHQYNAATRADHLDHVHWAMNSAEAVTAGGSPGILGSFAEVVSSFFGDAVRSAFDTLTDPAISAVRAATGAPPPQFREVPPALATKMRDTVRDFVLGKAEAKDSVATTAPGSPPDVTGISGGIQAQVQQVAARYGWGNGGEWAAIVRLVEKESGWRPGAANPTSSARGLFQKMTSIHGGLESSPAGQAGWGLNYIKSRYGTPSAALAFHNKRNYYDRGGVAAGRGVMFKDVVADERVLDPIETRHYDTLGPLVQEMEASRLPGATAPREALMAASGTADPAEPAVMPSEFVLTSGKLTFDGDGLVHIVDGRLELAASLYTDGRKV